MVGVEVNVVVVVGDVVFVVDGVVVGEVVSVVVGDDVAEEVCDEVAVVVGEVVGVDMWQSEKVPSACESMALFSTAAVVSQSSLIWMMFPAEQAGCGV